MEDQNPVFSGETNGRGRESNPYTVFRAGDYVSSERGRIYFVWIKERIRLILNKKDLLSDKGMVNYSSILWMPR